MTSKADNNHAVHTPEHESGGHDLASHVSHLELCRLKVRDALVELFALL